MNLEGLQFEGIGPVGAMAISFVAGGVLAIAYLRSLRTRPGFQRRILTSFRLFALGCVVWLLLLPILQRRRMEPIPPRLAVLLDRSPSMGLPLAPGQASRLDTALRAIEDLPRDLVRLEMFSFSSTLTRGLGATGGSTSLYTALSALERREADAGLGAVLVFSDGRATDSPGEAPKLRIFAVPLGPPSARDVSIEAEPLPSEVKPGQNLELRGRLTRSDRSVEAVAVELWAGQTRLEAREVRFPPGRDETELRFDVVPEENRFLGYRMLVRADEVTQEQLPARNNVAFLATSAIPERTRILLVSERAGFEPAFLGRQLDQEAGLEVTRAVGTPDSRLVLGDGIKGGPELLSPISRYAAIIAIGAEALSWIEAESADYLTRGGGLLVFPGARDAGRLFGSAAAAYLPLVDRGATLEEGAFPVKAEEASAGHALLGFLQDLPGGAAALEALPPMAWRWSGLEPRAGAQVLLTVDGAGSARPLLVTQRYGLGRVGLLAGGPIWSWRFEPVGLGSGKEEAFLRLAPRLARWAASGGEFQRFKLSVRGRDVAEPVQIRVDALQEDLTPAEGQKVLVELSTSALDGTERKLLETELAIGSGGSAEWKPVLQEPGHYRVRAYFDGRSVVKESAVAMNYPRGELAWVSAGASELQSLGRESGGRIVPLDQVQSFVRELATQERTYRMLFDKVQLWSDPWLLALVLVFLTGEWALRRLWSLP